MGIGHIESFNYHTEVYKNGKVYKHWFRDHRKRATNHLELLRRLDKFKKEVKH